MRRQGNSGKFRLQHWGGGTDDLNPKCNTTTLWLTADLIALLSRIRTVSNSWLYYCLKYQLHCADENTKGYTSNITATECGRCSLVLTLSALFARACRYSNPHWIYRELRNVLIHGLMPKTGQQNQHRCLGQGRYRV